MDLIPQKCFNWRRNGNTEGGLDCEQEFEDLDKFDDYSSELENISSNYRLNIESLEDNNEKYCKLNKNNHQIEEGNVVNGRFL